MSHSLAADSYVGIRIPLPSGKVVHCRSVPLSTALAWLPVLQLAQAGEPSAQIKFLREFPKVVAPADDQDAFEELMPAEVYELGRRFFSQARPEVVAGIRGEPMESPQSEATPQG